MKKILLIWEEVPEDTKFYVGEYEDGAEAEVAVNTLTKCHGNYLNTENTEEIDDLLVKLQEELTDDDSRFRIIFKQAVINCRPDYIFHTGIIL